MDLVSKSVIFLLRLLIRVPSRAVGEVLDFGTSFLGIESLSKIQCTSLIQGNATGNHPSEKFPEANYN